MQTATVFTPNVFINYLQFVHETPFGQMGNVFFLGNIDNVQYDAVLAITGAFQKLFMRICKNRFAHIIIFSAVCNFKPLSYCFEETMGFDVKASLASRPVSRVIR